MKKTLFSLLCIFSSGLLMAQWTPSGANIYTNADRIGLGTSTPGERLDIKGHLLINTGTADGGRLIWRGGTGGTQEYRARVYTDGRLAFFPGEGNPTAFTLSQNGNVGIGTDNTALAKLTIITPNRSDGIWLAGPNDKNISLMTSMTAGAWNSLVRDGDNLIMWKTGGVDGTNTGGLVLGPWSNNNTGMRITRSGNIGIGVSDPGSYKLAVEGKIGAREVKVTLENPWADYVFSENYNLVDLKALEAYIKRNNHLPGIPSAEEVKENGGIDLGEMNRKLLEKVEELTLYIIDQQKQIDEMKKKMQEHN